MCTLISAVLTGELGHVGLGLISFFCVFVFFLNYDQLDCHHYFVFVYYLVLSTSAIDCLERLVSKMIGTIRMLVGGVAELVERWSWPANFPYPTPDC